MECFLVSVKNKGCFLGAVQSVIVQEYLNMFGCAVIENSVAVLRDNVGRFFHAIFLKRYEMLNFNIHVKT